MNKFILNFQELKGCIGVKVVKIQSNHAKYSFMPQLGIVVNSELEGEFAHLIPGQLFEKKMIASIRNELSDKEIEERLCSIGNITLGITEQCNFRCSYCSYSGNYKIGRIHNRKCMNFTTARKAIDYLITLIINKKRNLKYNTINIGFYGGEALLEFKLVQKIMAYAKTKFQEKSLKDKFVLEFQLNTNGYLLKDRILDSLVEWNVKLSLSLDGPASEHDKFRLAASGNKTWEYIIDNLEQIKKKYPGYYENNIDFLVTLHPCHDYKKIDDFYFGDNDLFSPDRVTANFVSDLSLKKGIVEQFKKAPPQSSRLILGQGIKNLDNKLTFKTIGYNTKFTAMCFPGGIKLFVDSDGNFHICERIKANIPIGDVDNGIDYERIRSVQRQWVDVIIRNRCWECQAWSFCGVCAAQSEEENGVVIDCRFKDDALKRLKMYLDYKEQEAKKQEQKTPTGFNNIMDYIRQL